MNSTLTVRQGLLAALAVLALAATIVVGIVVAGGRQPATAATPNTTATDTTQPPGITVTGAATVTGKPDTLTLEMTATAIKSSVNDALAQANSTAKAIQQSLRKNGVDDKDLQTSGMSIQAQYGTNGTTITGYQVDERLTAKLRNLDKAGAAISAAVGAGGNGARVDNVSLDLDDNGALLSQARQRAVESAKAKAKEYADAAGRSLGELTSLTESVSTPDQPVLAGAARDVMKSAPVPIAAGSADVVVTVTAVYGLR